jgi:hypothetical protein
MPMTCLTLAGALLLAAASAPAGSSGFTPFDEARPVLAALRRALPAGLGGLPEAKLAAAWPAWARERDRAVRQRLLLGEEDTVVNLLFFGTSFTRAPRLTADLIRQQGREAERVLDVRLADLSAALAANGGDEHVALARSVFQRALASTSAAPNAGAELFLLGAVARVQRDQATFASELSRIHALPDATEQLAARATLFRERGIALDASLRPAYAVDEALGAALQRGLLTKGAVRRVALVGPGLDFVDKAEGQDYYPPQSLQALALADSLLRLGLARPEALEITAFDISPRVLDHLSRARDRAVAGKPYVVQLPRPRVGWSAPFTAYWRRFGDAVGVPAPAVRPPPLAGDLDVRAVAVRPEVVARVRPVDTNVVYQRLDLALQQRFDLVVSTNVFVYYDTFEQCLALANVARMTAVGGLLLVNNSLLELPGSSMRSEGYKTVLYSEKADDGEHVIFFRRRPER